MKKIFYTCLFLFSIISAVSAQVPQITSLSEGHAYPGEPIVISGSNFSANPSDLNIWFGTVAGEIINSSNTSITVRVPEEASFSRIAVTNRTTGLTGFSNIKFYTIYSGDEQLQTSEFTAPLSFDAAAGEKEFYDLCSCDLDGDGKPEIAATKFADAQDIIILKNNSEPENFNFDFLNSSNIPNLNVNAPTLYISCGDLNGDAKPELMMTRSGATRNTVFVLPNNSSSGNIAFGSAISLNMSIEVKSRRVRMVDLNFDGKLDLVVSDANSNVLNAFVNTSTTTSISFQSSPVLIEVPGAVTTSGLDIEDLNGDGKPDLIVAQFFRDNVFILTNTSSSTDISFAEPVVLSQGGRPLLNVKVGDLDLDGLTDIVATNTSGSDILLFRNTSTEGNLSFDNPVLFATGNSPWGIDMIDINGDNDLDIILGNQNQPQIHLVLNNSTPGSFSFERIDLPTDINIRNVISNDFDGDGKPDIGFTSFSGNAGPFRIQLLRNLNCYVPEFTNEEENITICPGQTAILSVVPNAAASYKWFRNSSTTPVQTGTSNELEINSGGTYKVEATTEGGGCVIQRTFDVNDGSGSIPSDPSPSSNGPLCEGETLNLSVPAVSGASYEWTGPGGFTSDLRQPSIEGISATQAGNYQVIISVGECSSNPAIVAVDVLATPIFTASSQGGNSFCDGSSVDLIINDETGYSYQWLLNGNNIGGATGTQFAATEPGVYSVEITNSNFGCTVESNEVELTVITPPDASFSSSSTGCVGESIVITNNSVVDETVAATYQWTFGNGSTSSEESPEVSFSEAGEYSIQLDISYDGVAECSDSFLQDITIREATLPTILADTTEICPGESTELFLEGDFEEINWSTGETAGTITIDQSGSYTVTTVDSNGCNGEANIMIAELPVPNVTATASRETINRGEEVQLIATGANTYEWSPSELVDDPNSAEPLAAPIETTEFTVTGSSIDGCSANASVTIQVSISNELELNPQKAFSPESTMNPTWVLDDNIANYSTCVLSIFDERGARLYEKENYANDWDGTYDGNPLPEGVYYYVFQCPDGGRKAGTILLVRN